MLRQDLPPTLNAPTSPNRSDAANWFLAFIEKLRCCESHLLVENPLTDYIFIYLILKFFGEKNEELMKIIKRLTSSRDFHFDHPKTSYIHWRLRQNVPYPIDHAKRFHIQTLNVNNSFNIELTLLPSITINICHQKLPIKIDWNSNFNSELFETVFRKYWKISTRG